jgi:hypothetical protein
MFFSANRSYRRVARWLSAAEIVSTGVLHAAPGNKAIAVFSIAGTTGTSDEQTITVDPTGLPLFSRVDAVVVTFKTD